MAPKPAAPAEVAAPQVPTRLCSHRRVGVAFWLVWYGYIGCRRIACETKKSFQPPSSRRSTHHNSSVQVKYTTKHVHRHEHKTGRQRRPAPLITHRHLCQRCPASLIQHRLLRQRFPPPLFCLTLRSVIRREASVSFCAAGTRLCVLYIWPVICKVHTAGQNRAADGGIVHRT